MKILVTGGCGYIGSHTCVSLIEHGDSVVVVDNLSNSKPDSLQRISRIVDTEIPLHVIDLNDTQRLLEVFRTEKPDAVIHFAGLKAVGESVEKPLEYYHNNVSGTISLLKAMRSTGCRNLVFSSSATVYGEPKKLPIDETTPYNPQNPYGRTKMMIEQILVDLQQADAGFNVILLRYFNPVGAHPSGLMGEDPNGIPNNLFPYITQVLVGRRPELLVFGNDYPTPDGTGVRDYIHVMDLAWGHVKSLEMLPSNPGLEVFNLGCGRGFSVLEVLHAFESATGRAIPYRFAKRRSGDVAESWADVSRVEKALNWRAERTLNQMCEDAWRWQSQNPNGFSMMKA